MLKKIDSKGFSIIEVLIVLAIAGLIMLVVFLAVPALRRNAANNGRQSDASRISSAVQDCLSNRNGLVASCSALSASAVDLGNLSQLDSSQVTFVTAPTSAIQATASTWVVPVATDTDAASAKIVWSAKCETGGAGAIYSTNSRDFAIVYNKKSSTGVNVQCIGS